jgi:hypothetical protein
MKNVSLTIIVLLISICALAQSGETSLIPRNITDFDRGMSLTLVIPSFMTSPHSNLSPLLVENGFPHIPKREL